MFVCVMRGYVCEFVFGFVGVLVFAVVCMI